MKEQENGGMDQRQMLRKFFGPPNFIFIHADQHRADCIRSYGRRPELYTPHMDSMGYLGARFDACYSACPVCIPARLSLLTGQSPQKHGVFDNLGIPRIPMETTLPLEMRKGGYQTALFGRTMHTYPFTDDCGFQEYVPGDPSNNEKDKDAFFQYLEQEAPAGCGGYNANGTANNSRFAAPFHLPDYFHQTMWATNRALEYVEQRKRDRQPFCLFLGYYAPHSPHNPPRDWFDYYMNLSLEDRRAMGDYDIPPVSNGHPISCYVDLEGEEYRRMMAGYYGNVSFIDAQVGRVMNAVLTMPNTYVIYTSDHGEMLGDHYHLHKGLPYQGSVHTPFLIYGPGIAGNQCVQAPFAWQDVLPTMLDLAGLPVPDCCDGVSFADLLLHPETALAPRKVLHGECRVSKVRFNGYEGQQKEGNIAYEEGAHYLIDGQWKYIWFNGSGREQLFHIAEDYDEKHDLSTDPACSRRMEEMRRMLARELQKEGTALTDGEHLIPGVEEPLNPQMQKLLEQRLAEGNSIAYYSKMSPKP